MKDAKVSRLIRKEMARQKRAVNLIASENFVSDDVREALGSVLVNKYAEGYPGARYYGGNAVIDELENLCISRALALFRLSEKKWHVNVQPLSGSPANLAAYLALVPRGGKIMGASLSHGGHLTHGHKVSATGMLWRQVPYGVSEKTERFNESDILRIAKKEKPAILVAGYTAYPRKINWRAFRRAADAAGAYLMADISHIAGLIAAGVHPSPFPYADVVTTTVHKTLRGPRAAMIFSRRDRRDIPKKIDKAVFPGLQGGPHENQIAAVAVALREAMSPSFRKYAEQTMKNARTLASELKKRGWRIVSGGTDNHLVLADVWMGGKGVSGGAASDALERAGIIVNKNTIPFDTRPPADPSGIRLGAAAETTRGAKEKDFARIAERIDKTLRKLL